MCARNEQVIMSDTDDGLALRGEGLECPSDRGGICAIEAGGWFVCEDDRRIHQKSAGKGDPLPLATGQTRRWN
jgi:hypothetical protein